MTQPTQDILEFRSHLINQLILFIAIASLFEVAILLSHVPTLGIHPYFIVRMTLIMGLWLVMLLRHRISYLGRVSLVVGMTWISIVTHLTKLQHKLDLILMKILCFLQMSIQTMEIFGIDCLQYKRCL